MRASPKTLTERRPASKRAATSLLRIQQEPLRRKLRPPLARPPVSIRLLLTPGWNACYHRVLPE